MSVYKNEDSGTWYVMTWYNNWKGEHKQKCKRGFPTKREAQEWERTFQLQNAADMDISNNQRDYEQDEQYFLNGIS